MDVMSAVDPSTTGVNPPIHSAASMGNAEIVEILLARGEW